MTSPLVADLEQFLFDVCNFICIHQFHLITMFRQFKEDNGNVLYIQKLVIYTHINTSDQTNNTFEECQSPKWGNMTKQLSFRLLLTFLDLKKYKELLRLNNEQS